MMLIIIASPRDLPNYGGQQETPTTPKRIQVLLPNSSVPATPSVRYPLAAPARRLGYRGALLRGRLAEIDDHLRRLLTTLKPFLSRSISASARFATRSNDRMPSPHSYRGRASRREWRNRLRPEQRGRKSASKPAGCSRLAGSAKPEGHSKAARPRPHQIATRQSITKGTATSPR